MIGSLKYRFFSLFFSIYSHIKSLNLKDRVSLYFLWNIGRLILIMTLLVQAARIRFSFHPDPFAGKYRIRILGTETYSKKKRILMHKYGRTYNNTLNLIFRKIYLKPLTLPPFFSFFQFLFCYLRNMFILFPHFPSILIRIRFFESWILSMIFTQCPRSLVQFSLYITIQKWTILLWLAVRWLILS